MARTSPGTIGEATNNGIALTGLAYGARLMPVRVLDKAGEGNAGDIAAGIRYAARHGAQVINLSLEFDTDVTASDIPQLLDAIAYAKRRGAVVIAASGNEAGAKVAYPARARDVMSVGATTENGCLSEFSNIGSGLDLVAPGGGADRAIDGDPNCKPDGGRTSTSPRSPCSATTSRSSGCPTATRERRWRSRTWPPRRR